MQDSQEPYGPQLASSQKKKKKQKSAEEEVEAE